MIRTQQASSTSGPTGRGRRLLSGFLALVIGLPLVVAGALPAAAEQPPGALPHAGPIDPHTGYPLWYTDETGLSLDLCFDDGTYCLATAEDPTAPPSVPDNWSPGDGESFYWAADARLRDLPDGDRDRGRAEVILALEATFANDAVAAGDQIVFGRVRLDLDSVMPDSTYRFTHPYGVSILETDDRGRARTTEDIGCLTTPCDTTLALDANTWPFLRWDASAPPPPAGHIGDPGVEHRVTGGPNGNVFRLERLGPTGTSIDTRETDLFSVQGRRWVRPTTPKLALDSRFATVDFGRQNFGGAVLQRTAPIQNVGAQTLNISELTIEGPDAADFALTTPSCEPVAPDATCAVSLSFLGSDTAGPKEADLVVVSDDPTSPHRIPLRAVAIDPDAPARTQGPIDPETGYPLWYEDEAGTRLDLCLDQGVANGGVCLAELPFPDQPPNVPDNWSPGDGEAFYWAADAELSDQRPDGARARLVLALESTFANEGVIAGDQVAFGRVRHVLRGLIPGESYTMTHPYGEETEVADEDGRIFVTEDIGCLTTPCDFTLPMNSRIGPFLVADGAPAGTVGDPNTDATVTGGPNGNVYTVTGPDIGGPGVDQLTTDLFAVQGRRWEDPEGPTLAIAGAFNEAAFGRQAVGTSATQTMELTNAGIADLDISSVEVGGADASEFSVAGDCATVLAQHATCPLEITFAPTTPGQKLGELVVTSDDATLSTAEGPAVHRIRLRGNSIAVDQAPVPSTPDLLAEDDSGRSATDNITNVVTPRFTGTAQPGATVELLIDGAAVASTIATDGTYAFGPLPALSEGTYLVAARIAGSALASAPMQLTIDVTPPPAPSTPVLVAGDTAGATFTGSAEANASVALSVDGTIAGDTIAAGDGTWSIVTDGLAVGPHTASATATDVAGNLGPASGTLSFDIAPPAQAPGTPSLAPGSDSGALDGITNVARPTFVGDAPTGATVELVEGTTVLATGVATGGRYSLTPESDLADGAHTVFARIGALASGTLTITIDTVAPTSTAPEAALVEGSQLTAREVPVRLTWSSTDVGSGVAAQLLESSTNGGRRWATDGPVTADQDEHVATLRPGNTSYAYRIQATDVAANVGAFSPFTPFQVQFVKENDRTIATSAGWARANAAGAFSGKTLSSSTPGATATLTFTGRQVAWVAPTGTAGAGTAQVEIDGVPVATVDLAGPTQQRMVVFASDQLAPGTHSLVVRVLTGRVDIDGFATLQ